jgi:hypothetical protein
MPNETHHMKIRAPTICLSTTGSFYILAGAILSTLLYGMLNRFTDKGAQPCPCPCKCREASRSLFLYLKLKFVFN